MTYAEAKDRASLILYGIALFEDLSDSKMRHDALQHAGKILEQHAVSVREEAYEQGRKAGVKEGCIDTAAILNPKPLKN